MSEPKMRAWQRGNPRTVLEHLIATNPKAGKRKLLELFLKHVRGRDGRGTLDPVAEYWFAHNYEKLRGDQP